MPAVYQIGIRIYYIFLWLASPFSGRARQWLAGRSLNESIFRGWQPQPGHRTVWMHVASLGEFEQGRPILEQWRQRNPNDLIALSFYSPSGYTIRRNWPLADIVFYLPKDTRQEMDRLVSRLRPDLFILVKYDFWPNMLTIIHDRGIPSCLVSARFQPGQYFFSRWGKSFLQQIRQFRWIFVQDEESMQLLKKHGIGHAVVAGDTRVDAVMRKDRRQKTEDGRRVVIGGSTWPPEEQMLADFRKSPEFGQLQEKWKLVIAPHDISENHLIQIERLFGAGTVRFSKTGTSIEQALNQSDILLIDSIGLLSSLYAYGDIAVIGGGFGKGIHNILEPAAFGLPVVFGPRWRKFREAETLISLAAAFPVSGSTTFKSILERLCGDENFRTGSGTLAVSYIKSQAGSTDLIIRHLLESW